MTMKKTFIAIFLLSFLSCIVYAGEIDDKTNIIPAKPKYWQTFPLNTVRLLPGSSFHNAMIVSQGYLLGVDVNRMINHMRKRIGLEPLGDYPNSNQPENTRPGDLWHYLSGVSLMYAQTGDTRFLERSNYIINTYKEYRDNKPKAEGLARSDINPKLEQLLEGKITLDQPDEGGYPWGGTTGNVFYGVHKVMAGLRDAYLYCDNKDALEVMIDYAEPIVEFALRANPDLFDDMLDLEHGPMNEVFADLYAMTGDKRYMDVSIKFNHQKVILNIADGNDVLYARHANMQVPTFIGTARQYQLTGNEVSRKATENFLEMVYHDHTSCIGANGYCERFGRPGEISKRLGFTASETCNTYNMLKVALNYFMSTGDLQHMEYFEKALYNHILASQDPDSGGVTYYTSSAPGGFKSYSKGYDLEGVWCCVGTGMENHSKYGEAIYFNNGKDLYVNLFIPSELSWEEKGLKIKMETDFPASDVVNLTVLENQTFDKQIYIRYPSWTKQSVKVWVNDRRVQIKEKKGEYIRLDQEWKAGDKIKIEIPQDFHLEAAADDPNLVAILHGPIVLAGELGTNGMPESDLVRYSLMHNRWEAPTHDIPVLSVNKVNLDSWIKEEGPLKYIGIQAGILNGKKVDISLIPYYKMHHQRYNLYWKMYNPDELVLRSEIVSDEIKPGDIDSEKKHNLKGQNDSLTYNRDYRGFWEFNIKGRIAETGGWFAYDMKVKPNKTNYLVVTYWGNAPKDRVFDILVNDEIVKTENIFERYPLTFFEEVYEIPEYLVKNKDKVTVKFQAHPEHKVGAIYGLRMTSNPDLFSNYLFY